MIIEVKYEINRFINKLVNNNIEFNVINRNKDIIILKINKKDYEWIIHNNYYSIINIRKYNGITGIILFFKKYLNDFILLIIFMLIIYFTSNVIVKVEVITNKTDYKNKIISILKDYGIKNYSLSLNENKLILIEKDILLNYRDSIDWISIKRVGMNYRIEVEERIINFLDESPTNCSVISKKDSIIKKINVTSGDLLVKKGYLVKKGDVLISGDILLNDEVKGSICAKGDIIGETWYKIKIIVPFSKNDILYNTTVDLAIEDALKELEININDNLDINYKKVLNTKRNNSTIELELFVSLNEIISETIYKE